MHWDIRAAARTCRRDIFCPGKTCSRQVYPRQKANFLIIMCTIRNFTLWAPQEAVNSSHESTYMVKYKEAIKYVGSIFILRQKMPRRHVCPFTTCNFFTATIYLSNCQSVRLNERNKLLNTQKQNSLPHLQLIAILEQTSTSMSVFPPKRTKIK